jgi:hypothetical protein
MTRRLFLDAFNEVVYQLLESVDGRQVHQQGNESVNIAILDIEIDVEK